MARPYKLKVPRQRGLTELCRTMNLSSDAHTRRLIKEKVTGMILDNYIQNGFTVLGIPTSIPDLAFMFNISTKEVYQGITKTARHLGAMVEDEQGLRDTYGALLSLTINQAMAITGAARHQTNQLQAAKNGRNWVPGLDRDLTASISAESKNITNLLTLAKHLSGRDGNANSIDITNQTLVQHGTEHGDYIGPNEAIRMIDKGQPPLLESGTEQDELAVRYGTAPLPEIIATKQQGLKDDGTFAAGMEKPDDEADHTDRPSR